MRRGSIRLAQEATQSGWFQSHAVESDGTLQKNHSDFYAEFVNFIKSQPSRGYGRWVWKPYLINHHLAQLQDDEGLVYMDAGCHLNSTNMNSNRRFRDYLDFTNEFGSLAMQLFPNEGGAGDLKEKNYNSIDLMDKLQLSESQRESCQIQATVIFLRPRDFIYNFTEEWLNLCTESNFLHLRENNIEQKDPTFIEYRWDQSIFSALCKVRGLSVIPDETWWGPDWQQDGRNFPIWAMRHRSGAKPFNQTIFDVPDRFLTRFGI
jgi:hypothetical protein